MTHYSLTVNRKASNMDGAGTDLVSGDTVTTNAFTLSLDIDCGFKYIQISNGGKLKWSGKTFLIDDVFGAGVRGEAGSTIDSVADVETPALFKSRAGLGTKPFYPFEFSFQKSGAGIMLAPYTHVLGSLWAIRNSITIDLPYSTCHIKRAASAVSVINNILGHKAAIKGVGYRPRAWTLTGTVFNDDVYLIESLISHLEANALVSMTSDRIFIDQAMITDIREVERGIRHLSFNATLLEA